MFDKNNNLSTKQQISSVKYTYVIY